MELKIKSTEKEGVFSEMEQYLAHCKLKVINKDEHRPWGGFFVLDEGQAKLFAELFFRGIELPSWPISSKLSPKILVVQPGKRLSWQYHHRRAEIWRVISGKVSVVTSSTDSEIEYGTLVSGESIRLTQGQRHRLVGLNDWGVVAEIWQHTDVENPSNEEDIVRLQDDFGR